MWKVKRMSTARIVVLTIAVGAGAIAAYLASGSGSKPLPTVAQLQTMDVLVAKSNILRQAVAPENLQWQTWPAATDDQALKRGDSVNVVRYGVSSPTAAQK
jgi:pilus assembly protein CpaB